MKLKPLIISTLMLFFFYLQSSIGFAQSGTIKIEQSEKIIELLELKKEINSDSELSNRYKIQIYNGDRSGAKEAKEKFDRHFPDLKSTDIYEPPNFKIWVGNFRTRLEADRTLKEIKGKFRSAFIFKPKKEKPEEKD